MGAIVFGASALLLLIAPAVFLDLLLLDGDVPSLAWSMRMIGLTLVALAGNMWVMAGNPSDAAVRRVGMVMAVVASGLGILTLMIPTELGWFSIAYAAVGFGFGIAYVICLVRD